jgi:hypothetical protein
MISSSCAQVGLDLPAYAMKSDEDQAGLSTATRRASTTAQRARTGSSQIQLG